MGFESSQRHFIKQTEALLKETIGITTSNHGILNHDVVAELRAQLGKYEIGIFHSSKLGASPKKFGESLDILVE
jgi:hypothetical protein